MAGKWFNVFVVVGIAIAIGVAAYAVYTITKRYQYAGHLYSKLPNVVQQTKPMYNNIEHLIFYDAEGHKRVYVLDPVNSTGQA